MSLRLYKYLNSIYFQLVVFFYIHNTKKHFCFLLFKLHFFIKIGLCLAFLLAVSKGDLHSEQEIAVQIWVLLSSWQCCNEKSGSFNIRSSILSPPIYLYGPQEFLLWQLILMSTSKRDQIYGSSALLSLQPCRFLVNEQENLYSSLGAYPVFGCHIA